MRRFPDAVAAMDSERKIAPCSFSKHYLIDESQAWQSLMVFFLYRLIVGSVLVFLYFLDQLPASFGKLSPSLYALSACLYLGSIFVSAVPMLLRRPAFGVQAQIQVLVDIALLPLIMHASGGIASGVGAMLGLSVAAGSLLIGGRCALLFAALATFAILGEEIYADLYGLIDKTNYPYAGMLGASYFGIALLAMVLAERAARSEAIAVRRGLDVANLEQLNEFVIRHLQSGILVIDEHHRIRMANEAADRLFPVSPVQRSLASASTALDEHFRAWLDDPSRHTAILKLVGDSPIEVRFTHLGLSQPPIYMAFLEDSALHHERVQQSKLASLGRLTASIAHEIRNPLSAITHASQLLAEAPVLDPGDRRLIEIILDHAKRLDAVIENILQISRRRGARRETIVLSHTLDNFLKDFQTRQSLAPEAFRLESAVGEARVTIDPSHLHQIIENLCSNALKYGRPELGPMILRLARFQGDICVDVIDHGRPIPPDTAQHLFEPFFTTSSSGTGLGLFIARELAELNQARLDYLHQGGTCCFRLYLQDSAKNHLDP